MDFKKLAKKIILQLNYMWQEKRQKYFPEKDLGTFIPTFFNKTCIFVLVGQNDSEHKKTVYFSKI